MKVHVYQIEVMWLMLAVLGFWARFKEKHELTQRLIKRKSLHKKPPLPNQIRPPPLFAWGAK